MAEDLSTYTEVDPNEHISATSSRATGTGLSRAETAYLVADKGENYFDALDIDFTLCLTMQKNYGIMVFFALANQLNHFGGFTNKEFAVMYYNNGSANYLYLNRGAGGGGDNMTLSLNTVYYCTLERSAGADTVNLKMYSDADRTTLLDTLTISGQSGIKWRYVYALNTNNTSSSITVSGYTENITINTGEEPEQSVVPLAMHQYRGRRVA